MKYILALGLLFSQMAFANITIDGELAKSLWTSMDVMGKIENTPVVSQIDGQEVIGLDTISCVYENYNACSFYANTIVSDSHKRTLVVALEGTEKFMSNLNKAGILDDEENSRMDVTSILCTHAKDVYSCELVPYIRPIL